MGRPRIIRVDPVRPERERLVEAVEVLRGGGLVAFPTETVYGLGAPIGRIDAVARIFKVKGRPPDNPLIVHIASMEQLLEVAVVEDQKLEKLASIWPGPVTVVLKRRRVPDSVTAGRDTVAVRMPAHPVALALINALGEPIAAPSANKAGKPSPTTAQHVVEDLDGEVDLVIDGGEAFFGVESTILDLTREPPTLLRPGPFTVEELEKIFGPIYVPDFARGLSEAEAALAPGMRYRHYAPEKPLIVVSSNIIEVARAVAEAGLVPCIYWVSREAPPSMEWARVMVLGGDPYEVARNLYSGLRRLDREDCDVGLFPAMEEKGIGLAIMNRVRKASKGSSSLLRMRLSSLEP